MSHLDTYRTQSGPQTRRERVQPIASARPLIGVRERDGEIPRATPAFRSPLTPPFPTPYPRFNSKPAYVPPHLRNRPAGDRDRDRGGFDRRDDRGGGASPKPSQIGGCLFSNSPVTHSQTNTRCLSPPRGATRVAHVIARYRPRSRRDAPVDGPPMGLPSGSRAHGRMHASRRASRASFRASLSSETLNSERSLASNRRAG